MLVYMFLKEKGNVTKIYINLKAYKKILKSKTLFDEDYYLKKYPNIKNSKIKPLNHYIYHGYKEGKNPSKTFDGNYYLKKYHDVKFKKINPLIHYVLYGEKEGRYKNKKEEALSSKHLQQKIKKQNIMIETQKNQMKTIKTEIKENNDKFKGQIKNQDKKIDFLKKYIESCELKQSNKEKIEYEIEKFKDCGITKEKRTPKIIVSLTSNPDNVYDVHYTIYTLLTQTTKPDEVILWLEKEKFPNLKEDLPQKLKELEKCGLKIKWCENLKSYGKLIPALQEYPDDIIVTANDNIFYPDNWLEYLYKEYDGNNIVAHKIKKIRTDLNDNLTLLDSGQNVSEYSKNEGSILNFPISDGGVLYPPNSLHQEIFNQRKFMKINDSDFWFWLMTILNNTEVKTVFEGCSQIEYINSKNYLLNIEQLDDESLIFDESDDFNKNIERFSNYYPELLEKIRKKIPPKVSVIIPVYNNETYLEECLDSVINQTLKDIEIICVNDGSTDNSLKILEKYVEKDKRFVVLSQENSGAGVARNKGLKISKGEYLSFIDADDVFELCMLEKAWGRAKKLSLDLINFRINEFSNDLSNLKRVPYDIKKKHLPKKEVFNYKDFPNYIFNTFQNWTWNKLFKRDFIMKNNIEFQEIHRTNDLLFTSKALVKAERISILDVPLVNYRKHVSSCQSTNHLYPKDFYHAFLELKNFLIREGVFESLKYSFVNFAILGCLYNLNSLKTKETYRKLYSFLHETGLKELSIVGTHEDYFYDKTYLKIKDIEKNPLDDQT